MAKIKTSTRRASQAQGRTAISRGEQQSLQNRQASALKSVAALELLLQFEMNEDDDHAVDELALEATLENNESPVVDSDSHDTDYLGDDAHVGYDTISLSTENGQVENSWQYVVSQLYVLQVLTAGGLSTCSVVAQPWMKLIPTYTGVDQLLAKSLASKLMSLAESIEVNLPSFLVNPSAESFAADWCALVKPDATTEYLAQQVPWEAATWCRLVAASKTLEASFSEGDFSRAKNTILLAWPSTHMPLSAFVSAAFADELKPELLAAYGIAAGWEQKPSEHDYASEMRRFKGYKKVELKAYSKRVDSYEKLACLWGMTWDDLQAAVTSKSPAISQ